MAKVVVKKLDFSRHLRREQTDAEKSLWKLLRARQFMNYKFRRQHVIGPFITDFCCLSPKLVVELDGGQHQDQKDYDKKRTEYLLKCGYEVIRFWDGQILKEKEEVIERIFSAVTRLGARG